MAKNTKTKTAFGAPENLLVMNQWSFLAIELHLFQVFGHLRLDLCSRPMKQHSFPNSHRTGKGPLRFEVQSLGLKADFPLYVFVKFMFSREASAQGVGLLTKCGAGTHRHLLNAGGWLGGHGGKCECMCRRDVSSADTESV